MTSSIVGTMAGPIAEAIWMAQREGKLPADLNPSGEIGCLRTFADDPWENRKNLDVLYTDRLAVERALGRWSDDPGERDRMFQHCLARTWAFFELPGMWRSIIRAASVLTTAAVFGDGFVTGEEVKEAAGLVP